MREESRSKTDKSRIKVLSEQDRSQIGAGLKMGQYGLEPGRDRAGAGSEPVQCRTKAELELDWTRFET